MQISGTTQFIAHLGYPTKTFRAPMIYNPYFSARGIDAVVVPMGCRTDAFRDVLRSLSRLDNFLGALITMPNKIAALELADSASTAARVCGAANAIRRDTGGRLIADMFDGDGFVRGMRRKGHAIAGASAFVSGAGGVGSAIAAALAEAGAGIVAIHDTSAARTQGLAVRLSDAFPETRIQMSPTDLSPFDIVVNATPLGMHPDDQLPVAIELISPGTIVGDVVLSREITPFLAAAAQKGCPTQTGLDMLFAQIPAYLEFFGLPTATADELRALAQLPTA